MAAAMMGYRMVLVMPEHLSLERRQTMRAFGAEIILTSKRGGMEEARDVANAMRDRGEGVILDQFANPDNPLSHYEGTGPEIWRDTDGRITHFVSSMGTTGTIMGCSKFFKEKNPAIQVIGVQPEEGSQIPGIRKWPEAYLPKIYDAKRVDRVMLVSQAEAEEMTRRLAREEGIFAGVLPAAPRGPQNLRRRKQRSHRFHRLRPRPLPFHRCSCLMWRTCGAVALLAANAAPTRRNCRAKMLGELEGPGFSARNVRPPFSAASKVAIEN